MKLDDTKEMKKERLSNIFGPLIGGKDLVHVLGFKTPAAFRQALRLNRLELKIFAIEGRRGKFALTSDIEKWLDNLNKNA